MISNLIVKRAKKSKMIKRHNAEKKTCTQSYHFSVDRK